MVLIFRPLSVILSELWIFLQWVFVKSRTDRQNMTHKSPLRRWAQKNLQITPLISCNTVCTRKLEETRKSGYSLNILTWLMSEWQMVWVCQGPSSWYAMSEWWFLARSAETFAFLWTEGNIPKVPHSIFFIAYLQNYTHFVWKMTITTPFLCPHISTQFLN